MPDFSVPYDAGFNVYALVYSATGNAWDGAAFVAPSAADWASLVVAMTYDAPSGTYRGSMPAGVPSGTWIVLAYLQMGASPAITDPIVGAGYVGWSGSASAPPSASFEKALVAELKADSVVAAAVGARVFPRKVPTPAVGGASYPALTYSVGSKTHERNLDGPSGIASCRVTLRALSRVDADAKLLAEQLRLKFDGFSGPLGLAVEVVEAWLEEDPDAYDQPADGSDDGAYSAPCDFTFRYRETVPTR